MQPKTNRIILLILAIIINIGLCAIMLLYRQPFNVDGILYLKTAQVYLQQGFHAALQIYPWPWYSIVIATVSKLFHLSLLNSALLLNMIFTSIMVAAYLLIVAECGASLKVQYWGLLVILLFPYLNHDRYNVLRDFGYYAFFLMSLWYLIRFSRQRSWSLALQWQISLLMATAFRLEGLALLALTPFAVLLFHHANWREKLIDYAKLAGVSIIALVIILISKHSDFYSRIPELYASIHLHETANLFQQRLIIVQQQILNMYGKDQAALFLLGGMAFIFVATLLSTLGVLAAVMLGYVISKRQIHWDRNARNIIFITGGVIVITLSAFLWHQLFLSARYIVPLVLLLLIALPFAIDNIWQQHTLLAKMIVMLYFLLNAIASFGQFGTSKTYLVNAGEWIAKHTPADARVYTNDPQLAYYAQRNGTNYPQDFPDQNWLPRLQTQKLSDYNYVAVVIRHNENLLSESQLIQMAGQKPIQVFHNRRDDKAYIFQTATGAGKAG